MMEIECVVSASHTGGGLDIGGAAAVEELEMRQKRIRRKSTAQTSAENVLSTFSQRFNVDFSKLNVRYNIPGGVPMDGPSAGIALAVALMSAYTGKPTIPMLAMTGEISALGEVKPVGGVSEKLTAACSAGAELVLIPEANWEDRFSELSARVVPVGDIVEVIRLAFDIPAAEEPPADESVLNLICSA